MFQLFVITFLVQTLFLFSHEVVSDSSGPYGQEQARLPCPPLSPRVCIHICWVSGYCLTILSSAALCSFCPHSFPASGSFPASQLFASGGQSIGASASASVFPMNIQGWFPLGLTDLILHSKGLSRIFSSTTILKHQLFSLPYGPPLTFVHDYWKNHSFDYTYLCQQSDLFAF